VTERLVNILKICYERDTFHGARQPDVKTVNDNNNNNTNKNIIIIKKERNNKNTTLGGFRFIISATVFTELVHDSKLCYFYTVEYTPSSIQIGILK
jgi:hypothetical protein